MAQPTIMRYAGAVEIEANTAFLGSSIPAGNTVMEMKTREGARVSVNDTVAFPVEYGDRSYVDSGATYLFDRKVVIAYGAETAV